MNDTNTTTFATGLRPSNTSMKETSPFEYYVVLVGHINEMVTGMTGVDDLERFEKYGSENIIKQVLDVANQKVNVPVREEYDALFRIPAWDRLVEQAHECGVVIDDTFNAYVEDRNGNIVFRFDDIMREESRERIKEQEACVQTEDDFSICGSQEADFGYLNLELSSLGKIQIALETDHKFDPSKFKCDLNFMSRSMTGETYYDGKVLTDVDYSIIEEKGVKADVFGIGPMA